MNLFVRKFLLKELPKEDQSDEIVSERYYLSISENASIRVEKKGEEYHLEKKIQIAEFLQNKQMISLTADEFNVFIKNNIGAIIRKTITYSKYPNLKVREYLGDYKGLIRAEVSFDTEQDAKQYKPLEWMGKEITSSPLGNESMLLNLPQDEFKRHLQ